MHEIDVEQIIADVRAEIEEAGYSEEDLGWEDIQPKTTRDYAMSTASLNENELLECIGYLKANQHISWCRPLKSGLKGVAQKVIRRVTRFLVIPIADDQSEYNRVVARSIELLATADPERGGVLSGYEERIRVLEERLSALLLEKGAQK